MKIELYQIKKTKILHQLFSVFSLKYLSKKSKTEYWPADLSANWQVGMLLYRFSVKREPGLFLS